MWRRLSTACVASNVRCQHELAVPWAAERVKCLFLTSPLSCALTIITQGPAKAWAKLSPFPSSMYETVVHQLQILTSRSYISSCLVMHLSSILNHRHSYASVHRILHQREYLLCASQHGEGFIVVRRLFDRANLLVACDPRFG